jgi:hypothetical protein
LDQNQVQNTSLDSVTAYKSKQQPESSLKSRYESETRFKVMNLVKELNQRTKLDQNQSQDPSLDSGLATNLNNHQKPV